MTATLIPASEIVRIAQSQIGVAEVPLGSNTGPRVIEYQATTAYSRTQRTGWPWCDAFYTWVCNQAGLIPNDGSASTAETYRLALARGEVSRTPVVGGAIIWPGTHIGIVVGVDLAKGVVYTIEGNSGDKVTPHVRAIADNLFINPKGITQGPGVHKLYWLDDPKATYVMRGPWRKRAYADKAYNALSPALQRRAKVIETGDRRFVMRIGQPPRRGPWLDPASRTHAKALLEKSLGRKLIERSTAVPNAPAAASANPSGPAEGLGKTT